MPGWYFTLPVCADMCENRGPCCLCSHNPPMGFTAEQNCYTGESLFVYTSMAAKLAQQTGDSLCLQYKDINMGDRCLSRPDSLRLNRCVPSNRAVSANSCPGNSSGGSAVLQPCC